jgi:hypothetical protein
MSGPISVAWFVPVRHRNFDRMPASVWIRCLQLIPYLEPLGIRSSVNSRRERADICVLVRMQDDDAYRIAHEAKRQGRRVVFDLCVNYFDETGLLGDGYGVTRRHVEQCRRMVELADAVTAASRYIEDRAREFHPRAAHLPDSVDRRHFRFDKTYALDEAGPGWRPSAIWCGYAIKAKEIAPFLGPLAKRDIPLTIVSDRRPELPVPFTFVPWRYASAPVDLLRGDFCIAPRPLDTPYNMGHSLFKVGVFLAQGVPALASPVPSYAEVLVHGRTGLLCESMGEWEDALERVLGNPSLLPAWSRQAREVMRPNLTEHIAARYAELFRDLVR